MKTLYRLISSLAVISAICALSSCKYLDREPYDAVTASGYNTSEEVVAAVNGAYQPMQWPKLYNMRMWTLDIVANNSVVGAGGGEDGIETVDLANFTATSDNFGVLDLWRGPAPGILRCNMVLKNINTVTMDESLKNRCIGEVKFLRAHYYFILVRLFGRVPLNLVPQEDLSDDGAPQAEPEQIYAQIIDDLKDAIVRLPLKSTYSATDLGRATKEAAMAELAKVYITIGENYNEVISLCDGITNYGYKLNADYSDNFNPLKKNGVESIFEVQYYGKTSNDFWDNTNQSSWLSTYTGPRNSGMVGGGWGWNQPTDEFVKQYEQGDTRKDKTILYAGCPMFDGKVYNPEYSTTTYNLRKFLVPLSIAPDYDASPANWVITRYAEVLLMKAEALNELGRTEEAVEPLYEVRKRSGLTSRLGITDKSQAEMRDIIYKERRIELAFEGQRWFDLIRRPDYAKAFFKSIGKTNFSDKNLLFPIPLLEMQANPKLVQNPGY